VEKLLAHLYMVQIDLELTHSLILLFLEEEQLKLLKNNILQVKHNKNSDQMLEKNALPDLML
jgi:hypothetical protein